MHEATLCLAVLDQIARMEQSCFSEYWKSTLPALTTTLVSDACMRFSDIVHV